MSNIKTAFCVRAKHRSEKYNNTKKYYNQAFFRTFLTKFDKFQQNIRWYFLIEFGKNNLEVKL